MSLFSNLNEQIKILGSKVLLQLQESPTIAQAKDNYENLTPTAQKITIIAGLFLILLLLFFIPLGQLSESQTSLSLFEDKRNLIRDLFKIHRESSTTPEIAVPPSYEGLKSSVESIISRAELLPEQNLGLSEGAVEGRLIPANLVSNVLLVKLAKLNLKQIVDIGSAIVALSDSVKMKDLLISANHQDTRYYDVTYKLYALKVPAPNIEPPPELEKNSKKTKDSDKNPEKDSDTAFDKGANE